MVRKKSFFFFFFAHRNFWLAKIYNRMKNQKLDGTYTSRFSKKKEEVKINVYSRCSFLDICTSQWLPPACLCSLQSVFSTLLSGFSISHQILPEMFLILSRKLCGVVCMEKKRSINKSTTSATLGSNFSQLALQKICHNSTC